MKADIGDEKEEDEFNQKEQKERGEDDQDQDKIQLEDPSQDLFDNNGQQRNSEDNLGKNEDCEQNHDYDSCGPSYKDIIDAKDAHVVDVDKTTNEKPKEQKEKKLGTL